MKFRVDTTTGEIDPPTLKERLMSKGILQFNLDDPHELLEFNRAVKATNAYLVLFDYLQELRRIIKYGDSSYDTETAEKLRSTLNDFMDAHGVDMNDLE